MTQCSGMKMMDVAFERELIELAAPHAVVVDPARERDDRVDVGEIVVAQVDEPEHQRPAVARTAR